MDCAFDLVHYRELLGAARSGGYRFAFFDREPEPRDLLLRHDVDMVVEAALEMAELEAAEGVAATYFVMRESEFYNLESRSARAALARLRQLGHRVGLHAVYPDAQLDARFDPVIAWHTPDPEYMSLPVDGAVNAMQPGYFDPGRYRSDSNQRWRHGCPHDELARGGFEWLQLLVHPEIWVYPGETMAQTMDALLDAEHTRRRERMVENRIDLS